MVKFTTFFTKSSSLTKNNGLKIAQNRDKKWIYDKT